MTINILKLTKMLEAEKAALEGWGGLSDVEKAAYYEAYPASLVAVAAEKPKTHTLQVLSKKSGGWITHSHHPSSNAAHQKASKSSNTQTYLSGYKI